MIKEKQCNKKNKENDGHLQHMMANLLIIYNLFQYIFLEMSY